VRKHGILNVLSLPTLHARSARAIMPDYLQIPLDGIKIDKAPHARRQIISSDVAITGQIGQSAF
jgi:hypothetical protein